MKIVISETQYNRLIESSDVDHRIVKNLTNLVEYITSVMNDKELYNKQSDIDVIDYDGEMIVIAFKDDTLTFTFNSSMDEAPYYRPGTYEDPPEGSDGYWIFEPVHLKYEKDFDGESITVYSGKDFTRFVMNLPDWLDENIQDIHRKRYEGDY